MPKKEPFHTDEPRKVGQSTIYTYAWGTRGWVRDCITPWGNRSVELTGEPDTFFSRPARLQLSYNGKRYHVPGFVTVKTVDGLDTGDVLGWEFHGNTSYVQELPWELRHRGK